MADPFLIRADAILTMDPGLPRVLRNAGMVITGERITAIGELSDLRRNIGTLPDERTHIKGLLVPGFVNAHTHLELSYLSSSQLNPAHFTQWVSSLMAAYPPADQVDAVIRGAVRKGIAASLAAGVTTLGDISRHAAITRSELVALAKDSRFSLPRVVSFGEVVGLGKMRQRAGSMIDAATAPFPGDDAQIATHFFAGISPHAPYTVEGPALRQAVTRAIIKHAPIAIHLAELSEEAQFLRNQSGPLGRDWDVMLKMDVLDDLIPPFPSNGRGTGGPIRWAQRYGLLVTDPRRPAARDLPVLLAHVNYCDNAELAQLAASHISIAYCPRTHAYFGHPPHRYRDMLASDINVCLATDSLASNPDLSALAEARFVCRRDGFDPMTALGMITRRAALALGLGHAVGTLSAGKFADFVTFPLDENTPDDALASTLMKSDQNPSAVYIGGTKAPITAANKTG